MGKGDLPCRSRPRSRFPAPRFNPLPLYIALFCLLWSFAFVAGKIGVTDCPPLILLAARFSLAGVLILGITALRGEAMVIDAGATPPCSRSSASPTTRFISGSAIPASRPYRPASAA